MAQDQFKRKLTTIFSADVAGYSRLMGENEAATVKTLEQYKQIMSELIRQHRGRVVDSPGDNLLAEFTSVVDAVQCALAVQKEHATRNAELSENRKMQFRIGVNLGDVIEEGERIYGDGVNIASRLETLADPGGICISKAAFDQIETKLPLGYEYLGEQTVKNISKPVAAYRVLMEPRVTAAKMKKEPASRNVVLRRSIFAGAAVGLIVAMAFGIWHQYLREKPASVEKASVEKMAYPLPDKPSIAVMPFVNMSGDVQQEYLGDGITEAIIAGLSKIDHLFIIARNSTFTYKGKTVKVQQVAEELGVRYVLEGSVQRSGNELRVTAQLIDALSGHQIWTERYDRELKNLFEIQDEITFKVMAGMQLKLTEGDRARLFKKSFKSMDAYLMALEATGYIRRFNIEGNNLARKMAEEIISLDPEWYGGYRLMSAVHMMDYWLGSTKSPKQSLDLAIEMSEEGLSKQSDAPNMHAYLGFLYAIKMEYEKATEMGEKSVELEPNNADGHVYFAMSLNYSGKPEKALAHFDIAFRLNPYPSVFYYLNRGHSYRLLGRFEDAVEQYKKSLQRSPKSLPTYECLASTYIDMGLEDEARAAAAEIIKINPKYSVDYAEKTMPYKDQEFNKRFTDNLRKAGLN